MTNKWIRPAGAPRCSYRYKCPYCERICYQVTGNNGKRIKDPNPRCTYIFCPWCGEKVRK